MFRNKFNNNDFHLLETERLARYAMITDNPWIFEAAFNMFEEDTKQLKGYYGIRGLIGKYKDMEIALIGYGIGSSELLVVLEELFRTGVRVITKLGYGVYTMTEKPPARIVTGAIRMDKLSETIIPIELPAVPNYDLINQIDLAMDAESIPHEAEMVLSTGYPYPHLEEGYFPTWWRKIGINVIDVDTATLYVISYYRRIKSASIIIPVLSTSEIFEKGSWIAYEPKEKEASEHEKIIKTVFEAIYQMKEKALIEKKTKEIKRSMQSR